MTAPVDRREKITRKKRLRLAAASVTFAAFVVWWLIPIKAQVPQENRHVPVTPAKLIPPHEMTPNDVEAFLDGLMPLQLGSADIAGAVIVIVKDGNVLFQKGYGYSDVAKKTPVTAEGTLFRIGSVSKLLTWTALMQLVEQGKVSLDGDVNQYIDFKIPATYEKPITVRNLMTHTPGLNEAVKDLIVKDSNMMEPLGEYLKLHEPTRIYPPGVIPAYSNWGATLAGYIVQRVSGQAFDDYVEQHILQPLNMTRTTFRQPLPPMLKPFMSNGYTVASEPTKPFEFVLAWPAGSVAASGLDMSHFMLAHLQNGRYESFQLLRPDTIQSMHSRQFAYDPRMNGMCLGFYEETRNGHRIIGHAGDTNYFHSDLHLMQDANVGFFVSYNSPGKSQTSPRQDLWQRFLDRYFPFRPPAGLTVADAQQDANKVAGNYIASRRSEGTIISFLQLAGQLSVSKNQDGTISINAARSVSGQPKRFREIAPLLFREVDGQDLFGFNPDSSGQMVLSMDFPFFVFQRASLSNSSVANLVLLIFCLLAFLLTLLFWPIAAMVRRHYGRTLAFSPLDRRLRFLVRLTCLVNLVFAAGWISLLLGFAGGELPASSLDFRIRLFQLLGWLGIIGALLAIYAAYRFLREPLGWWFKTYHIAVAVACFAFVWFILKWRLLRFSLDY